MKLFFYLFVAVLTVGGAYFLFLDKTPPQSDVAAAWSSEAQACLTKLIADQIKSSQTNDWTAFDADLAHAETLLIKVPAGAESTNFRDAIAVYRSQAQLRAQFPK